MLLTEDHYGAGAAVHGPVEASSCFPTNGDGCRLRVFVQPDAGTSDDRIARAASIRRSDAEITSCHCHGVSTVWFDVSASPAPFRGAVALFIAICDIISAREIAPKCTFERHGVHDDNAALLWRSERELPG